MSAKPFSEAELERFEWLMQLQRQARAGGTKLTAAQRLELRGLRARKGAISWAVELAKVAARQRKIDDRVKYLQGGLVAKAGLGTWSDDELLGGFLALAAVESAQRAKFVERAREFNSKPKEEAVWLRVTFAGNPGKNVLAALHKRGFEFDNAALCWNGVGLLSEVQAEAALSGGTVGVVDQAPAVA